MTKFSETQLGGLDGRSRPHPSSGPVPAPKDRVGWAEYWGDQCLAAIRSYEATGNIMALEHAVRSARLAWWRACKAKGYTYWRPENL